ncbi:MAG: MCE family protein [Bacteroidales bacterium]|nr:MCE family protein [Bacteroidales bacterium]
MKISREFKIGFFAVTVMVASFFLINYLRGEDIFNREIEISSRYQNVEGLVPSAPVFIKGYKAGKVAEVNYDAEKGDFEVVCSVMKEFAIPEDSRMTIYSVDIMGGKGVRIDLGTSAAYIGDGGVLSPSFEAGLMDGLAGGLAPLLEKVTSTMDSLAVTVSGVNRLLADGNQVHFANTLAHLEKTMADLSAVAAGVGGKSAELETFIVNMASLSDKFGDIADKADSTMTSVTSIAASISESDLEGTIESFRKLLMNMNDPDGTIGKLFVDNSVYDSVEALLSDVDSLVQKIQENPKKYIRLSVF